MINPEWIEAAADLATAVEKGVAMRRKPIEQAAAVAVPAVPDFVINNNGISGDDFLKGVLIMAGAILLLAVAMLASAAIVHHGLIA